jgi:hypothetical protein
MLVAIRRPLHPAADSGQPAEADDPAQGYFDHFLGEERDYGQATDRRRCGRSGEGTPLYWAAPSTTMA